MAQPRHRVFESFRLDLADERLWQGEEAIALTHKAFGVLRCLTGRPGQLVTKDELLRAVWPETVVVEAVLTTAVRELRRALGDEARNPRFIETVHRRGYRFIAAVNEPAPVAPPISSGQARPSPLVGRDEEWAQLQAWLATVARGKRQIGFIAGESGIGKTALVDAFVEHAAARDDVRVAHGQCIEHYGAGEAYLPVFEALARLGRQADGSLLVDVLRTHAPSWLVHLPALLTEDERETLARATHQVTSVRMLRELAEAIEVLTSQRPLILVLEDLHWSDTATLEWLAYVARRRDPAALLVLGTYRPVDAIVRAHPLRKVVAELHQHPQCSELVLDYLPEDQVAAYVRRRCGEVARVGELARVLHQRTSGHPLFLVTIMDELLRQWQGQPGDRDWDHELVIEAVANVIPASVREFIDQQVEQLDTEQQQALEAAGVAGNTFSVAAVAAGGDLPEDVVETYCTSWARQGKFLTAAGTESWPDGTVAARYRFRHALFHEVLYKRVSAGRRVRLHQQIGRRLEAAHTPRAAAIAAELAMHFEHGQEFDRAVIWRRQAADNAIERSAYAEALAHIERGLGILPRLAESRERLYHELRLQLALGTTLMAIRGWGVPEAERALARTRELCEALEEPEQHHRALWGLVALNIVRGELEATQAYCEEMLALAERERDPLFVAVAHLELGMVAYGRGDFARALAQAEKSAALYDADQHPDHKLRIGVDLAVFNRSWSAHALWHLGSADQARARSERVIARARALEHPFSLAIALAYATMLRQFTREADRAEALAEATLSHCREHGFPYYESWAWITRGWVRAIRDGKEAGIAEVRRGIEALETAGGQRLRPYYCALLTEACLRQGLTDAAREALDEAFAAVRDRGELLWTAELHRLSGELELAKSADRHLAAEAHFQRALEIARQQRARALELRAAVSLGRLWQGNDKHSQARELLAGLYGGFEEGLDLPDLRDAQAVLRELESFRAG